VLAAELEVTKRYNHSMMVSYVEPSQDAAIASSAGKDFKFVNNTEYPIYIEGYMSDDKELVFNIYGVETRDPSRTVEYQTEILEKTDPGPEVVYVDDKQPLGYIDVQSKHIGYKARLWKVVKVDGVEVSREIVNTSKYKASPRSATIGVMTEDLAAYNKLMAAAGTQDIDHVKHVLAELVAR
jgi:vancomycin resistance protein YoaR